MGASDPIQNCKFAHEHQSKFEAGLVPFSAPEKVSYALKGKREIGLADGARIRQLYGNKAVLRRTLAF
jgi:hypothetical protein